MYRKVFANKVFDRKVVLITGGCAGIGRALAMRLAQAGARLVILDLQQAALDSLVQHLADHHNAEALGLLCDVADAEAVQRAVADVVATHSSRCAARAASTRAPRSPCAGSCDRRAQDTRVPAMRPLPAPCK